MKIQRRMRRRCSRLERVRATFMLLWPAVALAACIATAGAQRGPSAPKAPQSSIRVQLFDIYTGLPISNAEVEVTSDNGIRCSIPPCPTNGQSWSGRTDASGVLAIPPSAIQFDTSLKVNTYRADTLPEDAIQDTSHTHQLELYPDWLEDEDHSWTRGYKLVDARSGKLLASTPARIEFPTNDWPGQHGGVSSVQAKTNSLGYLFFSFLRKPEAKQGQTFPSAPEADWVTPVASVAVSGYRKTELNYFDGSHEERSIVRLQK